MAENTDKPVADVKQKTECPEGAKNISTESGIEVFVSDDKQQCWARLSKTDEGGLPEKGKVERVLEEYNIVSEFVKTEELDRIYAEFIVDRNILVAEGKQKKDGVDGEIKYSFKTSVKEMLKEYEEGKIDYKELSIIQQVETGDVLAELIPPAEGEDGTTLTGETAKAEPGVPAVLPQGKNTQISEGDPGKLVSTIDGSVSLNGDKVDVEPVVIIDGNVDYSTGNIDFDGSIIIKGGISAGFSVKSHGDVTVLGTVEDAAIDTEKNVILKSGFIGKGTGRIMAGGDVCLQFAENQFINTSGNLHVADALLHCTVKSDGTVTVLGAKGVIGGFISARESIDLNCVGSPTFTATELNVGMSRELREKIDKFNEDLKQHKSNKEKVSKSIHLLNKIKLFKRNLSEKQEKLFVALYDTVKKLDKEKNVLNKVKMEIDDALGGMENARINIKQKVYPGVKVGFGNLKNKVKDHGVGINFRLKDNKIVAFKNA